MAYGVRAGARVVNVSLGGRVPCLLERDVDRVGARHAVRHGGHERRRRRRRSSRRIRAASRRPNIVCVAATDRGEPWRRSPTAAPRASTSRRRATTSSAQGRKAGERETILDDGFETPLDGRWGRGRPKLGAPFAPRTGGFGLADSLFGRYSNTDKWARVTGGIDLRGGATARRGSRRGRASAGSRREAQRSRSRATGSPGSPRTAVSGPRTTGPSGRPRAGRGPRGRGPPHPPDQQRERQDDGSISTTLGLLRAALDALHRPADEYDRGLGHVVRGAAGRGHRGAECCAADPR